jgi:hypothetical protein
MKDKARLLEILAKDKEELTDEDKEIINQVFEQFFCDLAHWRNPDESKAVKCIKCKWAGTRSQADKREVNSTYSSWRALGGREGFEWHCPNCDFVIDSHYTRMS